MSLDLSPTALLGASLIDVIKKACDKIGASLIVEPDWRCVGQITYPSGIKRYFRLSTLDINTMAASEIARDKDYARFFLQSMGYPVAIGRSFLSKKWGETIGCENRGVDEAWQYALSIGLPVFLKPNSLSRGIGVSKVFTRQEFYQSARVIFKKDKVMLVEEALRGNDYRIVVLDGNVISAYQRFCFKITGDGVSTIFDLIENLEAKFRKSGRNEALNKYDYRIKRTLKRSRLSYESILEKGRVLVMLDNANLSSGGTSVDVTDEISAGFATMAKDIAQDMGLRLVGVDLMIDGEISGDPQEGHYWVIEVNSAPGLDHYASIGEKQQRIVDNLYYEVIAAMERPQERFT